MKRVLYDCDVILDVLLAREPFYQASLQALDAAGLDTAEGWISAHAVTNLFYILRKQIGGEAARAAIGILLTKLSVAPVDFAVIQDALASPLSDFEDAVTEAAGRRSSVDEIVTRNTSDYAGAELPVTHPDQFSP